MRVRRAGHVSLRELEDVSEGRITKKRAREVYGVVIK